MVEVFLGREALGAGLTRHDLRRWYRPIFRGVYVPNNSSPALLDRALGAWLTTGRVGVIGGSVASALHGAEWIGRDEPVEIFVGERRRQAGLVIRMDRIADDEVVEIDGLPVTTPGRTAFDMGRHLPRVLALSRLDALRRAAAFHTSDVMRCIDRYGPVRGVRQLRELLPLIDCGAESPKESWLRLLIIDAGLPAPETQIPVLEGSIPIAYLDMGWREIQLAVEYDGDQHRERKQYVKDLRRIPMLERRGWEIIRVIAEDRPRDALRRIREAYARRGGAEIDEMSGSTRRFAA